MKNNKNSRVIGRWVVLGLVIIAAVVVYAVPGIREKIVWIFRMFANADVEKAIEFIRSYGRYAMVISILLMVLQSVAAPLPAFLITFANAAIFGWYKGALLSWSGAMLGALLCFVIARVLGRDVVERLTSRLAVESVDRYFERYGKNTILICRLLPFISFDFVSYGAGLTSMRLLPFLIATGIGQVPATLVYSYVGGMLTGGVKMMVTALFVLFALTALIFLVKKIYKEKHNDPMEV